MRRGCWHRRAAEVRPLPWVLGTVCACFALALTTVRSQELAPFGERVDPTPFLRDAPPAIAAEPPGIAADNFTWGSVNPLADSDLGSDVTWDAPVDGMRPWKLLPWHHAGRGADAARHRGIGDPLVGTSWLNRPLYAGWIFGGFWGDDLSRGQTKQHEDILGGYRLGWDFDHYWGTEARLAFTNVDITDRGNVSTSRTAHCNFWDVNLLYYPWGDSRWRPYGSLGVGWGNFEFTSDRNQAIDKALLTLPVGGGVKYFFKRWMAVRLSVTDYWAIGQGSLSSMHNVAITADVEMHFGGRRTSYFPYSGSIHMW